MDRLWTDAEIRDKGREVQGELGSPRCAWVREAWALEGLDPTDPRYIQALYLDALDRTPTSYERIRAADMARRLSSCGIFWEALGRRVSLHFPLLWKFYDPRSVVPIEQAITADVDFAKRAGAWVDATTWREGGAFPREGDGVIIGNNTAAWARGNVSVFQHMLVVVAWAFEALHSIDGGQPGIRLRSRALVEVWTGQDAKGRKGELWESHVDLSTGRPPLDATGRPLRGRRVLGWIDASRLPYLQPPRCLDGEASAPGYPDERR